MVAATKGNRSNADRFRGEVRWVGGFGRGAVVGRGSGGSEGAVVGRSGGSRWWLAEEEEGRERETRDSENGNGGERVLSDIKLDITDGLAVGNIKFEFPTAKPSLKPTVSNLFYFLIF